MARNKSPKSKTLLWRGTQAAVIAVSLGLSFSPLSQAATQAELEQQVAELKQQVQMLIHAIDKNKVAIEDVGVKAKMEKRPSAASRKGKTFGGNPLNFVMGNTDLTIGGFVKLDAIFSDYSDGQRAAAGIGEDFLVPSVIPVGGDSGDVKFNAHAKTSRFNIKTMTKTEHGHVKTFFEFDAIGSAQGDERISNSYSERMRHAFIDWNIDGKNSVLAGQTWSTFFNVGALPESLDFVGPVGTIFERQPQLRYTRKLGGGSSFMLAAENPSSNLTKYAGGSLRVDDNSLPDLIARFNGKAGGLSYTLAAMSRELKVEQAATNSDAQGYAVSLSGKYKMQNSDELRFMFNYGDALGRYMALNGFNAGVLDANGEIDLIDAWGGVLSYKHHWSNKWRSNLTLSAASADNPSYVAASTASDYQSLHANLLYSPVKSLTLGGEYIYATKELQNTGNVLLDDKGALKRLQLSVKYAF